MVNPSAVLHRRCLARFHTRSTNPRKQAKAEVAQAPKAVLAKDVEGRREVPRHARPPKPRQASREGWEIAVNPQRQLVGL